MAKSQKSPSLPGFPTYPPVVVVLGHVDHGKTTLLDTIRKTNVVAGEAGGITQHIGAYQVWVKKDDPTSIITFIDTPGHEAFSKMRSRGASVADLAVLVVAANDGVKPQTKEAISHIKQAGIPFIVAINKIDIEGINLDVVKAQLAENEVIVEDYGGDIVSVPISARNNTGVKQLLEMIELLYELAEKKERKNVFEAVVLESYVDSHKGVVANALVRSGSVQVGDIVFCQNEKAKVRTLLNENSKPLSQAGVSQPIQLLGFKDVLPVGGVITSMDDFKAITVQTAPQAIELSPKEGEAESEKLKIIIRTDVAGTLEAIKANLTEEIELIGEGVGDITESDVLLARSTGARIIGFHVRIPRSVVKLAEMEEVKIETFDIIYHLLEKLQERVLKLTEPAINEEILGKAEIIAEFKIRGSHIAGCQISEGIIGRSERIRITRGEVVIGEPRIGAMQIERKEAKEAKKGQEVALVFRPDINFKLGDTVVAYKISKD